MCARLSRTKTARRTFSLSLSAIRVRGTLPRRYPSRWSAAAAGSDRPESRRPLTFSFHSTLIPAATCSGCRVNRARVPPPPPSPFNLPSTGSGFTRCVDGESYDLRERRMKPRRAPFPTYAVVTIFRTNAPGDQPANTRELHKPSGSFVALFVPLLLVRYGERRGFERRFTIYYLVYKSKLTNKRSCSK